MTDFYKGKKVFVLGAAGFVGRHLSRELMSLGALVYKYDNFSRDRMPNCLYGGDTILLDIVKDTEFLRHSMEYHSPFAVFNLAAKVAGVEYNQTHHVQMFQGNSALQSIPVSICEQLQVPHFLQVSSACVYGKGATWQSTEDNLGGEPVAANSGYSWAKRMGERVVQWSNLPHSVIVRPSNIYGPGDWYDDKAHVIPKLIKGHHQGNAKLFGNGLTVRQFIHVKDTVEGMLHALEFGGNKEIYNLGPHNSNITILGLHQIIASHLGVKIPEPQKPEFDQGDDKRASDCSKIYNLGWKAKKTISIGLKETIEDYLTK